MKLSWKTTFLIFLVFLVSVPLVWPEEGPDEEKDTLRVFYDRGFRFGEVGDDFSLRLNGLLQVRYSYVDYDPLIRFNQQDYSNFYLRRARLYFSGHAGSSRFTYLLHLQLEPSQGMNSNDLWLEYRFSQMLRLGAGRNKIAYGLEFMNSGSALGMVDRSIMYGETDIDSGPSDELGPRFPGGGTNRFGLSWQANTGFATGGMTLYRSQGIQLQGRNGSEVDTAFEYQVGLWQGRNTRSGSNTGNSHLFSARVGYHPFGWVDWRFVGDIEDSQRFKIGVLASAFVNSGERAGGYDEGGYNLAVMSRYRGWSIDLEFGSGSYDYDLFDDNFDRRGWRVAVGWFVIRKKLEVRARTAEIQRLVDPTFQKAVDSGLGIPLVWNGDDWTTALEAKIAEYSVAMSYRLPGWRNKLAIDFSRLIREFAADSNAVIDGVSSPIARAPDQVDYRIRTMVQLVF